MMTKTMEVAVDEDVVLSLVRGEAGVPFCLNVNCVGPVWVCSITTADGMFIGEGNTFRQALVGAFDYVEKPELADLKKALALKEAEAAR